MGWIYTVMALASGGVFLAESHRLLSGAKAGIGLKLRPMRLFHLSITYLTVLFVGVAIDPIWHLALPGSPDHPTHQDNTDAAVCR